MPIKQSVRCSIGNDLVDPRSADLERRFEAIKQLLIDLGHASLFLSALLFGVSPLEVDQVDRIPGDVQHGRDFC